MNTLLLLLLFLSAPMGANAQADTLTVSTNIEDVTVYRSQAQIVRVGTATLKPGKTVLIFPKLSRYLQANSVSIQSNGSFTLYSQNSRMNYLSNSGKRAEIEALERQKVILLDKLELNKSDLIVNEQELEVIQAALQGLKNEALDASELTQVLTTYRTEFKRLQDEKRALNHSSKELNEQIRKINNQLNVLGANDRETVQEVIAILESNNAQMVDFTLSYMVQGAGWEPSYEIRTPDITDNITLSYKANIYQNTGFDWENIAFTISSADPSVGFELPELNPAYAQFYTSIPRPRRQPSMAQEMQLEEVVITGYGNDQLKAKAPGVSIVQNQTNFNYKLDKPFSVPSDGDWHTTTIRTEDANTSYDYYAVPKQAKYAFLMGNIEDWESLDLINGDAQIFFNNQFIGNSTIDPYTIEDSLQLSLGKDERILISREKLKEFEERNFFGNKTRETLVYEITIKNTKQVPISIKIEDQVPLSTDESIKISVRDLSDGSLNKESGIVSWNLNLEAGEQKVLRLSYQMEYPKGKRVIY